MAVYGCHCHIAAFGPSRLSVANVDAKQDFNSRLAGSKALYSALKPLSVKDSSEWKTTAIVLVLLVRAREDNSPQYLVHKSALLLHRLAEMQPNTGSGGKIIKECHFKVSKSYLVPITST